MIKIKKGSDMISAIEAVKAINDVRNSEVVVAAMASDAGYKGAYSFEDLETLVSELPHLMKQDGPMFVSIKVIHAEHAGEPFIGSTKTQWKNFQNIYQAINQCMIFTPTLF
jgi:glutamate synthase domain-containing protein 2